jgi:hypothetical protein
MRCDELRAVAGGFDGLDAQAEEHLAGCQACFTWLERRDPLTEALLAARPPLVQPSPTLAADVVTAWRATTLLSVRGRAMLGLGAAAFLAAACVVSIMVVTAVWGGRIGVMAGLLGGWLGSLVAPVSAVAGVATSQFLGHPAWLVGLVAVTALAGWAWTRIDVGVSANMREPA